MTTLLLFLLFVGLLVVGVPVAFSLSIAGTLGMLLTLGIEKTLVTLPNVMYGGLNSFTLIAIPLYVLMGNIMIKGRLSDEIYNVLNRFIGQFHGGMSIVTVCFCTIFAAISGSSVATAATVGMLVLPEMLRAGYQRKFIFGLTAAGGTLGILIPPSLNFILYGALTDESVGRLFIAGIIPGLLLASMFMIYSILFSWKAGYKSDLVYTWPERFRAARQAFWSLLIIPIIMVGIYMGVFTATEAAGVGAVYALIVSLVKRRLSVRDMIDVLLETVKTSCMVLLIVVGAMIFGYVVTVLQLPQTIINAMVEHQVTAWQFLLGSFFLILFLGCFVECVTIMVLMVPILYPVVLHLGIDPIWFAVFLTVNMELALITPPVGLNLFVINTIVPDSKLGEVYWGVWPFLAIMCFFLILLCFFPSMATWLPTMMMGK
ncbi:MAG TPA: TRAP transporter large permease [Syntrophorhabdaceae bacterium]|nr:TRAP transporter large permease [Syntrophorhabdaceae bacterium]